MATIPIYTDPTLDAVREAMAASQDKTRRDYIGASLIGHPCARHVWYEYNGHPRPPFNAYTLACFADGHRTEELIAERLRMVEGIELWTHKEDGSQFGWIAMDGKFKGHVDGVIRGLKQAPKALHVWECKCVGPRPFAEFAKFKAEFGEKRTLEKWNERYFTQAQLYMHYMKMDRHYLVVASAGGREMDSCRTEYQPEWAERFIERADAILQCGKDRMPTRISEKPCFFICRMCPFGVVCHNGKPT